jgi:hypothetical protein
MKLKLISDGTSVGTKLIDEDTGEMVHGIQSLSWEADAEGYLTSLHVHLFNVPVEIACKATVSLMDSPKENGFKSDVSKTFEKNIRITTDQRKVTSVTSADVKISDADTRQPVSAIQKVSVEVTPEKFEANVVRVKFDNKDW